MSSCCQTPLQSQQNTGVCPLCEQKGKNVQLLTLKALLQPSAMKKLEPNVLYWFCSNPTCTIVYFTEGPTFFVKDDIKVPVFQKDKALDVFVCYCFGWTRENLIQSTQQNSDPVDEIRRHVQAKRCGCEVNNPQGSCCLGNVAAVIKQCIEKA